MYNFTIFMAYNDETFKNLVHTFLILNKNDKFYWIENNLRSFNGHHGPFISEEVTISYIANKINIACNVSGLYITKFSIDDHEDLI